MRNRIAHDYRTLDDDVVWAAVTHDVPALQQGLRTDIAAAADLLSGLADD